MRIFKYIFKMSMLNTLISFLVIIGLVWVSQSFRSIKFIFEKGGTIIDFFKLSIFSMPAWLSISISFGFFFGVFITFTKLENDRELIAMKSSGLNLLQLSYPIFVIGIILSSFLFLNFHFLLPKSYSFYKNYEDNLRYKKPPILFNENSFFHIDKKTFFAQSINGNELKKLFIKDYSSEKQTIDIFAKKAIFIPEEDFDFKKEVSRLKSLMNQKDCVNIFLSEGAGQDSIIREMESNGQKVPRDAFGHVRLDEINPGKWFAKQFAKELNAEKTLVQKSGYFARSSKANNKDLELIRKSAFFAAEKAIKGMSGLSGLDEDKDQSLRLIEFERIKGGKPFNISEEWYKNMLIEIGQK